MCLRPHGRGVRARVRPAQKHSSRVSCPVSAGSCVPSVADNRARTASSLGQLFFRSAGALLLVVSLAAVIVLGALTSSWAEVEHKRVLMLHSFGLRFKPWSDYAQIIRSEISRKTQRPVDFMTTP